jgi:hypothetical protein
MTEILFDKNAAFLFTAYGVFLGALAVYLLSIKFRNAALDREETIVHQIEQDQLKH